MELVQSVGWNAVFAVQRSQRHPKMRLITTNIIEAHNAEITGSACGVRVD